MLRRYAFWAAGVLLIVTGCRAAPATTPDDPAPATETPEAATEPPPVAGRPDEPASPDQFRADSAEHIAATGRPQLIEFFAYWCSVCNAARPTVHRLEAEYWGRIDFVYLDIDDPANQEAMQAYGFTAQPLFVFIDADGNEIERWFGYTGETAFREAFDEYLNSH